MVIYDETYGVIYEVIYEIIMRTSMEPFCDLKIGKYVALALRPFCGCGPFTAQGKVLQI